MGFVWLVTVYLTLAFVAAKAAAVQVFKKDNQLILRTNSCSEADALTDSLREWLSSSEITKPCQTQVLTRESDQQPCETDITNCVPDHVFKYQNSNPALSGPNCFNLALVMKNILPALRFSSASEMSFYMRPPLCRKLNNSEKINAGDVGAVRLQPQSGHIEELHGFIYVSDNLVYSKGGFNRGFTFALQSTEEMFRIAPVANTRACRFNEPDEKGECLTKVLYFRCISMKEYLDAHPSIPTQIMSTLHHVSNFETCVQNWVIDGVKLSHAAKTGLIDTTKALVVYLNDQLRARRENVKLRDEDHFLLGSLQLRLRAIATQLEEGGELSTFSDLQVLSDAVATALKDLKQNP